MWAYMSLIHPRHGSGLRLSAAVVFHPHSDRHEIRGCHRGSKRGKFGWQVLLGPCCKCTRTEMADDDDFAQHATLMESMTRAPAEGPILRRWNDKVELLRDAFTDETLRRMARKAGTMS